MFMDITNCSSLQSLDSGLKLTQLLRLIKIQFTQYKKYEGWNFNSGNYLFTTDTK